MLEHSSQLTIQLIIVQE